MLALSRKKEETIIINGNIEITILDISKDQVKLGVKAPKSIPIHRKEVYLQIQQENKEAANASLEVDLILSALKNDKKSKKIQK